MTDRAIDLSPADSLARLADRLRAAECDATADRVSHLAYIVRREIWREAQRASIARLIAAGIDPC